MVATDVKFHLYSVIKVIGKKAHQVSIRKRNMNAQWPKLFVTLFLIMEVLMLKFIWLIACQVTCSYPTLLPDRTNTNDKCSVAKKNNN